MSKVLVLGGGIDQQRLPVLLKGRGHQVVLVDADSDCPGKALADEFYAISTIDEDRLLELAKKKGVSAIASVSTDRPLLVAARLSEKLSLYYPISARQARIATSKEQSKPMFVQYGIPTSPFRFFRTQKEFEQVSTELGYPLVVKPVDSSASRGVSLVQSGKRIDLIDRALKEGHSGTSIAEKFIKGQEISVDGIVIEGDANIILITDGLVGRSEENFGLYQKNSYPSSISETARRQVAEILQKLAGALRLESTLLFAQMIVVGDEVFMIEFSLRNAGAAKSRFMKAVLGVDIIDLYVQILLQEKPFLRVDEEKQAASLNFIYGRSGRVASWQGFEECVADRLLDWYQAFKAPGYECRDAQSGADRLGVLAVSGKSQKEVLEKTKLLESRIKIRDPHGRDLMVHGLWDL